MILQEFLTQIEETYKKHFPYSRVSAKFSNRLYSSIYVYCYLAGCKEELSGSMWDNDMLKIIIEIDTESGQFSKDINLDSSIPDNLVMNALHNHYFIKPEDRYTVYGSHKANFRKTKGNYAKLLKAFDVFCNRLKDQIKDDLASGLIHNHFESLVADKIK